jgi:hypothetical protein
VPTRNVARLARAAAPLEAANAPQCTGRIDR